MLNLDMIGRNPEKPVEIVGDAYGSGVRDAVEVANEVVRLPIAFGGTNYAGNSDHHPFYVRDIPMMFFFSGLHGDYHQLGDHADKLAYDRMEQIARVAYGVVDQVASVAVTPHFIHQILWLGAEIQVLDGDAGAKRAVITSIENDSRASRAGLVEGDVITQFNGELRDARRIGALFRDLEPGAKLALAVARQDKTVEVSLQRARPGYLGVYPSAVEADVRAKLGLGAEEGALIRGVTPDGPAAKSGMKDGDILIRIAGLPVDVGSLSRHLARIGAGEKVDVVVVRGQERVTLKMVLGDRPQSQR
jgi:C-terminal processing protease CtpA/Prc